MCFPLFGTASARWKTRRDIPMKAVANPPTWLAGYIPDIPTPFDEEGAVDLDAFARLCERQIEAGVTAIVVSETSGEASTLTPTEQESIIRAAVEVARGRVHVIAGAGSNSTGQAIELTQRRSGRCRCGAVCRALLQQTDAGGNSCSFPRDCDLDRAAHHPARRSIPNHARIIRRHTASAG